VIKLSECVAERTHQLSAKCVAPVRAIDRQDCDPALSTVI